MILNISYEIKFSQVLIFVTIAVLLTILGTISHEYSHFIVARYLGLKPILHYDCITFNESTNFNLNDLYDTNTCNFFISTVAGTLQTIIFGLIGFVFSYKKFRVNKFRKDLNKFEWMLIFTTLFLLRPVLIFFKTLIAIFNNQYYFQSDESFISYYLGLPFYTISLLTGTLSITALFFTFFTITPLKHRINLILGLILGSSVGYFFWFKIFGVLIFP